MGSKTSINTTDITKNDASNLNAVTGTRIDGNGNTAIITDGESVKNALLFANKNADGTTKTLSDVIGLTGTLAQFAMTQSGDTTKAAIENIARNGSSSTQAMSEAYALATGSTKKETIYIIGAGFVLVALFFLTRKK